MQFCSFAVLQSGSSAVKIISVTEWVVIFKQKYFFKKNSFMLIV
jgi:hypothetical protein